MYRIGVFDSGVGGKSVANALQLAFPNHTVVYVNDSDNVPYGTKSPEALFKLVLPIFQDLSHKADVIVIACNTVSTTLLDRLEHEINVPLVPVEPMLEKAVQISKKKTIVVCATPTTLASERYADLKNNFAQDAVVLEPDCSNWASMIETDQLDRYQIFTAMDNACKSGADVIVLGCTHYHWIEHVINEAVDGRAVILQPEQSIIRQVATELELLA